MTLAYDMGRLPLDISGHPAADDNALTWSGPCRPSPPDCDHHQPTRLSPVGCLDLTQRFRTFWPLQRCSPGQQGERRVLTTSRLEAREPTFYELFTPKLV